MIKVNVGCGKRNFGTDWVHVDRADYPHIDFKVVFLHVLDNDSIDIIYSSHLIAYFDRDEVLELINSWYLKLKPGGILRIATPDHGAMTELYQQGINLNYFLGPMYGKMKMNNETIYHKTIYDFNSLKTIMEGAGFKNVTRYDHKTTEHAQFDDHSAAYINDTLISLNVQGYK